MVEESQTIIDQIVIEQSSVTVNIDASKGALKVQQNIQQSMVDINLDSSSTWEKTPVNIEQSAVNVNLSVQKK